MNRKIIIILFVLIILLSFAAGTILLLTRDQSEEAVESIASVNKVMDQPMVSALPSFDATAVWFFDRTGRLYRANADGTNVSEFTLPSWPVTGDLVGAKWPKKGNDFVALGSKISGTSKNYYDNTTGEYTTWPDNVKSFDWMPDGRRVVYIWQAGDGLNQQLVMANADTSGFRIITDVFWPDLKVYASPDGQEALLVRSKPDSDTNKIYKADLNTGQFEIVIGEKQNLDAMWLPDGLKFLFTQDTNSLFPKILLYDFTTRLQTDLNLNTSFEKVVLDRTGNTLFAAVPREGAVGDVFVSVDLKTFQQKVIYEPENPTTAKNLFIVNGNLYFINTADNKLYHIAD